MTKARIFLSFHILLAILTLSYVVTHGEAELTESQKLKAENWKLKAQLTQCNINITQAQLKSEQEQLINEYRKQLNAKETDKFDWNSLTFTSK